jgi:hypothetical protein
MHEFLFNSEATLDALQGLADLLADRSTQHQTLIIVRGSYLALHNLRHATRDVDSITRITAETKRAIADIAKQRNYAPEWLNDAAAAFYPIGLLLEDCSPLFEHRALTVVGPTPDWIFLMKLFAGRTVDQDDLRRLWPHTSFGDAAEVVERYSAAYPFSPDDPFLAEYVEEIIRSSGSRPTRAHRDLPH